MRTVSENELRAYIKAYCFTQVLLNCNDDLKKEYQKFLDEVEIDVFLNRYETIL